MIRNKSVAAYFHVPAISAFLAFAPAAFAAGPFKVGGMVSGLQGSGLVLSLDYQNSCIPDNGTFTLQSTDSNDCFSATNVNRCCSQSVKSTVSDNISTVTCTCGVVVVGFANLANSSNQTVDVPANATSYTFPQLIEDGTYTVSVMTQPSAPAQFCSIQNSAGTVNEADVANANVVCSALAVKLQGFDVK